ncbi:MAG: TlpA family protein disulfide reductase [Deltaproteobacteria bacterium]|jgi:cytochrome c biogenesis protein CcmG, thiol:disulfide interchange protein DsbE|nr:TlpA family protein disulfide reductase [Deltaproteobacteria bacterium]MBT4526067.1 TlpA family protein disulfide reductase [Deltaproteobacteria bacterium]
MKQKTYFIIGGMFITGLFLILAYGLFFADDPRTIPSALINKKARPFSAMTFKEEGISLKKFLGQPIVLNFWASWCFACRQEAHILEAAHRNYTPNGAVFIGIAINDTRENSLKFIEKYQKTYLLAPDDKTGTISLDYGVTAVPETFLIDKEGFIRHKQLGAVTKELLDGFLDNQLSY